MNILQLRYFLRTAELNSVSKVANEAHIFAPAVSNHIKALEEELGTKLFTRNRSQMHLNKNGEIMYQYGQKILHALTNAEKEIADQNNSMAYSLKVATLTTPRIIPKAMNAFRKQYPQPYLQVQQYQRYSEQLLPKVEVVISDPAMTEIELVASNLGIIFMPQLTCFDQMNKISLVKVKGVPMKRYINVTWREQPYQPKVTQLFVDFIYDFFSTLNNDKQ